MADFIVSVTVMMVQLECVAGFELALKLCLRFTGLRRKLGMQSKYLCKHHTWRATTFAEMRIFRF
jgi:hypothetical protein